MGKYEQEFQNDDFIKPKPKDLIETMEERVALIFIPTRLEDQINQDNHINQFPNKQNQATKIDYLCKLKLRHIPWPKQCNVAPEYKKNHGYSHIGSLGDSKTAGNQRMPKLWEALADLCDVHLKDEQVLATPRSAKDRHIFWNDPTAATTGQYTKANNHVHEHRHRGNASI